MRTLLALLLLGLAPAALGQAPPSQPPESLETLQARGARTAEQLARRPASWAMFFEVGEDFVVVDIVSAPPRRAMNVAIERLGERTQVLTILEVDGRWLVAEAEGVSGAYRPWEAPLVHAALLGPLARAQRPETVVEAQLAAQPSWADATSITWSTPSPPEAMAELEEQRRKLREWLSEDPARTREERVRSHQAFLTRVGRELLEGTVTTIERSSGLVLVSGPPGGRRALASFAWLETVPEERFAAAAEKPPADLTADPTAGDVADLALLGQAGDWTPQVFQGGGKVVFDARLVQLSTGAVRRIPFDLGPCLPGAFSADRRRVYVTARGAGLWEVDLRTRAKRRLVEGACAFPALSPDGKTLAVLHTPDRGEGRVLLVDVATGAAKPLGPAVDGACLAWLPTGRWLLMAARIDGAPVLARLGLDGRLEPLRPGALPLVLPDGASVAFLDPKVGLWFRTRLEPGAEPEPWLGGLRGLSSPALSPDGRRLLMVDRDAGPVLIDVATAKGKPLDLGRGAWGLAVWR